MKYHVNFLHCVRPPCLKIDFLFLVRFAIKSTKCKFLGILLLINLKVDKMEIYINYIIIINTLYNDITHIYVKGFYKRHFKNGIIYIYVYK